MKKEKHCYKKFKKHGRHSGSCTHCPSYQECYGHYLETVPVKDRKF